MTKTAVINVKVDPKTKKAAQKAAKEIGIPLSTLLSAYLKDFARNKAVNFSLEERQPDGYLRPEVGAALLQASEDYRKGVNISPTFSNAEEMDEWLMQAE